MKVYRIMGSTYASDISGTGAAIYGGRWNRKGTPVLYTGESKEIALLETIVHLPPMLVPDLDILTLEIPDDGITELTIEELPKNWNAYSAPTLLAYLGDEWIKKGETVALKVPSFVIHTSHNYILNCRHVDYAKVKLLSHDDFHFDARLNS